MKNLYALASFLCVWTAGLHAAKAQDTYWQQESLPIENVHDDIPINELSCSPNYYGGGIEDCRPKNVANDGGYLKWNDGREAWTEYMRVAPPGGRSWWVLKTGEGLKPLVYIPMTLNNGPLDTLVRAYVKYDTMGAEKEGYPLGFEFVIEQYQEPTDHDGYQGEWVQLAKFQPGDATRSDTGLLAQPPYQEVELTARPIPQQPSGLPSQVRLAIRSVPAIVRFWDAVGAYVPMVTTPCGINLASARLSTQVCVPDPQRPGKCLGQK